MRRTPRLRILPLALLLALVGAADRSIAVQPGYPSPVLVPSVGEPQGLAVGDLNHDGNLDLIATSPRSGRILMHRGRGDGSFVAPRTEFVGGRPVAVATADFDGDGLDDIVFVDESSGNVGILLQRATFPVSYLLQRLPGADEPTALLVADLDGDGWPDVLVAQSGADQVSVFPNLQGSLGSPTVLATGDAPHRMAMLAAALQPTLLVLQSGYLSRDVMSFDLDTGSVLGRQPFQGPTDMILADHDGNSSPDLVVLDGVGGVARVFDPSGGSTFSPLDSWPVEVGGQVIRQLPSSTAWPRYLVADSERSSFSIYTSTGSGIRRQKSWLGAANLKNLILADFDRDGSDELAVAVPDLDAIQISPPLGQGFMAAETVFVGRSPERVRPRPTGQQSLSVLCTSSNEVWSFDVVNQGLSLRDIINVDPAAIRHGWTDVDGDGDEDLITLVSRVGFQVQRNSGGGFDPAETFLLDGELQDLAVADVIGTPDPDVVVANATMAALVIYEGDGAGNFVAADTVSVGSAPARIRTADLDVDGREDLIVLGLQTQVAILFRRDTGLSNAIVLGVGMQPRDAAVGDFNGDPYPDIVVANAGAGSFSVLTSVVNGIYSPTVVGQLTPSGAENVLVTDIDLNGQDDLLFSSPVSPYVSYHLNTGTPANPTGDFTLPQRVRVGVRPLGMMLADLDGDPVPDLIVVDAASDIIVLVRTDPSVLASKADLRLSGRRRGTEVLLEVSGTAVTSAEFQLRRGGDGQRLRPEAVGVGRWEAVDGIPVDAPASYLLYDRAGRLLDEVEISTAEVEGSTSAWTILPPRSLDGVTEFSFRSPSNEVPRVEIVDLRGRRVTRLVAEADGARWHRVRWRGVDERGRRVSRGRYWTHIEVGRETRSVPLRAPR